MSFDEEPDDPHGECREEIERLRAEIARLTAPCGDELVERVVAVLAAEWPNDPTWQAATAVLAAVAPAIRAEERAAAVKEERDRCAGIADALFIAHAGRGRPWDNGVADGAVNIATAIVRRYPPATEAPRLTERMEMSIYRRDGDSRPNQDPNDDIGEEAP